MPSSESLSSQRGPELLRGALYVMRGVLNQVSGLAGILAFLAEMWNRAPIQEAVFSGAVVGGSVYLILLLVDVALEQIIVAEQRSRLRGPEEDEEKEEIEVESGSEKSQTEASDPASPDPDQTPGDSAGSGDASTSAGEPSDSSSENKQLATV